MAIDPQIIKELVAANLDLEALATSSESEILAAFRRAEAAAFKRIRELLLDAPRFDRVDLETRLAWYFQNIPSQELLGQTPQSIYGRAVASYLDDYEELGRFAERILRSGGVPRDLTAIPPELIRALRGRDLAHFTELNAGALARLDQHLLDSVILGRPPSTALAEIRGTITGSYKWGKTRGLYEWHAGTYARTANMRFSRQVLKVKADEVGLRWFIYIGPFDSKKRPFCLGIVGGAFRRDQIEEMDNGQTGDAFSDGGGFNCRDTWSPTDKQLYDEINADPEGNASAFQREIQKQRPPAPGEELREVGAGARSAGSTARVT